MQSQEQIIQKITKGIALFWMVMKLISLRLWLGDRNYPLVPLVDMPSWLHILLLSLFFVSALYILIKPGNKYAMMFLVVTEMITLAGDQNRLQPWHYQFIFMFIAILLNQGSRQKAVQGIVLITISIYFFSGLQKLNPHFIQTIWSVHILQTFFDLPGYVAHNPLVAGAGYLVPVMEIAGGLGLLFSKTMKAAAYLLISMHLFILLFLGPFGLNFNIVVWPWNLLMILLLYALFINNRLLLKPLVFRSAANYVITFFWVLMPVVGLFGYWDKFLSSGMYSGREKIMQFYFEDADRIPPELRKYAVYNKEDASARIALVTWCVQELNVAPVLEPRVLNSIVMQLNERHPSRDTIFRLTERKY